MSEISGSVNNLITKLMLLDSAYETKLKNLEKRETSLADVKSKLREILNYQESKIIFNVGGKKKVISRHLIVGCIYSNILMDILENAEKEGNVGKTQDVFIDRNPDSFYLIIDIIRRSSEAFIHTGLDISLISDLTLSIDSSTTSIESLKSDIKYYFKEDQEKVFEHFNFSVRGKQIKDENTDSTVSSVKVSTEFPSDQLSSYRAKSFDDISKIKSKKAYFISYDSTITFELREEQEISCIEIRPFIANLDYWVPSEGASAYVFGSLSENGEFDFLTTLPEDYGFEFEDCKKTSKLYFDKRRLKYIRIQTGDFILSVSYIKFS